MEALPPLGQGPLKQAPEVADPVVDGFRASAAHCGLRKDGREDLALIVADEPVAVAGITTRNLLPAAPVQVTRRHLRSGRARAILANCGGANAATGQPGIDACLATCREAAALLGCAEDQVLPCSTGVIGLLLDAGKVCAALPGMVEGLSATAMPAAAGAIMTTDVFRKMSAATATIGGRTVKVLGMAKGAGMIRPDMATMLAFVLTDAAATPQALQKVVAAAAEQSFNRATVDGDTSTNDTLLLLASGRAGNAELTPGDPELAALTRAVTLVCRELAAMMVADGEGAGHLVLVHVTGAASEEHARHCCYGVANSPLVKTALAGSDPNWGRILSGAAAESARRGMPFEPDTTSLWIGDVALVKGGMLTSLEADHASAKVMKQERYGLRLDLGLGSGSFWVLTSDLDHGYINVNVDYRS